MSRRDPHLLVEMAPGGRRGYPATRTSWSQIFSATLRRAERALGLMATSSSEGRTGRRVMMRRVARWPRGQTGCWGGARQSLGSTVEDDLTKRASWEWRVNV